MDGNHFFDQNKHLSRVRSEFEMVPGKSLIFGKVTCLDPTITGRVILPENSSLNEFEDYDMCNESILTFNRDYSEILRNLSTCIKRNFKPSVSARRYGNIIDDDIGLRTNVANEISSNIIPSKIKVEE